jgi:hypothetical protein
MMAGPRVLFVTYGTLLSPRFERDGGIDVGCDRQQTASATLPMTADVAGLMTSRYSFEDGGATYLAADM